jgi:hypothetical protein
MKRSSFLPWLLFVYLVVLPSLVFLMSVFTSHYKQRHSSGSPQETVSAKSGSVGENMLPSGDQKDSPGRMYNATGCSSGI